MADSLVRQVEGSAGAGAGADGAGDGTDARSGAVKRRPFLRRLVEGKPIGTVGAIITVLLLLTGIFADVLAPHGFNETQVGEFLEPPSRQFWLGTDNLGRDVLSRVIYGARISMIVGLAATTLITLVSMAIGIPCGYWGGKLDLIVQRFVDGWMCLPYLPILMVVMAIVGPGLLGLILVMGISGGISGSRFARSVVINIKENSYLQAATAVGCPTSRVLFRHVLPNILPPLIVSFSLTVPGVILGEAALSFLGFGIPAPAPSWGGMLSGSGRRFMFLAPWMVIWPGLALSVVVYGVNMFGDAVRDLLDPRLQGGGSYRLGRMLKIGRERLDASNT